VNYKVFTLHVLHLSQAGLFSNFAIIQFCIQLFLVKFIIYSIMHKVHKYKYLTIFIKLIV